jgi:cytochrome P450
MTAEPLATLPTARTCPYAPRAEHIELQEQDPVSRVTLPSGSDVWAVAKHADVRAVLSDPRFSSDRDRPGFPRLGTREVSEGAGGERPRSVFPKLMLTMDAPEHGVARRAVLGEFTHRRLAGLRPRIQQIVDEHIDAMLAGPRPVDLMQALALPVPSLVICELLGVPYADHDFFQERASLVLRRGISPEESQRVQLELAGYLDALLRAKEKDPTDDLLGRQILRQREETGAVDRADLVGLSFLLLTAGHETTANMITLGTLKLSQDAKAREAIRQDPDKTLPAVEEMLRYFTIAEQVLVRAATEDVELGGKVIKEGDGVLTLSHVGNRDPEAFEDPDVFDIERGARNHLAFGFGAHQCIGQNLARLELQIVVDTLLRRIPDIRPAVPVDELPFKEDSLVYGIHELPVTW